MDNSNRNPLEAMLSRRDVLRGAMVSTAGLSIMGLAACGDDNTSSSSGGGDGAGVYNGVFAAPNFTALVMTLPLHIANVKGYFEANRLNLKVQSFAMGTDAVRAIATTSKMGVAAVFPGVIAYASGMTRLQMVGTALLPNALVFVVKPDSGIEEVADLKGKKVGIQSATSNVAYAAVKMLEGAGLTRDDVEFVNTKSIPDTLTALDNGVIDCGFSAAPLSTQGEADGKVRVLWAWATSDAPKVTESGVFVDRDFLASDRDVVRRFLKSIAQGQQFIGANPTEAAEIYSKDYKVELTTAQLVLGTYAGGYQLEIDREGVELNFEAAKSVGLLTRDIAYEDFVDDRLAGEVLASL